MTKSYLSDEACVTNLCVIEMHPKHFLTARKPVWRLNRLYLNHDVHAHVPLSAPASRSCIMTKLRINLYISNTTTV